MKQRIRAAYQYLARLDLILLLAVLMVVGGTYCFIEVLDEVREGEVQAFDNLAIQIIGGWQAPRWVEEVGRDLTALGGIAVLALMTAGVGGYLLLNKKYHALVLLLVATIGALVISMTLKSVIDRPRPAIVEHRSYVMTKSFPSGHAMLSASVYLTLGALLARLTTRWLLKIYFVSIAMVLTALVGISRVFLGVHWPTDVLAGWSAGLVWAILCWIVAKWLQSRGQVEPPE